MIEQIFLDSVVLSTITDQPLTTEYISSNIKELIPDYEKIKSLEEDFINLYNNKLSNIINLEDILNILHKYRINTYYNKLLEYIIWQILNLKFTPTDIISNILHDIVEYNKDFSKILNFLLFNNMDALTIEDFLFSVPLLELGLTWHKADILYNIIDPTMAIKYELMDVIEYLVNNGKCPSYEICDCAVKYGNINVLEFAHLNNYEMDGDTVEYAFKCKQDNVIKLLHSYGLRAAFAIWD